MRLPRRPLRALALAAASLAAGACAPAARALGRPYAVAPTGLEVPEQALRDALAAGRWADAARRAASPRAGGPSDALLRALYEGTAGFYAGRYAESAAAFDRAGRLADARYTKRVSRGALALVTNDRALPYLPGDNERLMAGYYGTLAYLHANDLNGAAVEARRLALALQAADARRDPLDRSLRAALRYLTGAVFEAAGEREDAGVAYRNAALLGGAADTGAARRAAERARAAAPPPGTGEVVAVVEGGFVAHRVDERLSVRLDDDAAEALAVTRGGVVVDGRGERAEAAWPPRAGTLGGRLAALLTGDAGLWAGELPQGLALADSGAAGDSAPAAARTARGGREPAQAARLELPGAATDVRVGAGGGWERDPRADRAWRPGRVFSVAWPAYRRPRWMPRAAGLSAADAAAAGAAALGDRAFGAAPGGVVARGDLSAAAAGDFRRDRGALLARLVARSAVRATVVREAGRTHRELGDVVRTLSNAVEHADTRSWHLLPGEVQVVRLRLPAGARALSVDVDGRRVPVGTVHVAPGAIRFVSVRLWDAGGYHVTAAGVDAPPPAPAPD